MSKCSTQVMAIGPSSLIVGSDGSVSHVSGAGVVTTFQVGDGLKIVTNPNGSTSLVDSSGNITPLNAGANSSMVANANGSITHTSGNGAAFTFTPGGGTSSQWGAITGTITDQADLIAYIQNLHDTNDDYEFPTTNFQMSLSDRYVEFQSGSFIGTLPVGAPQSFEITVINSGTGVITVTTPNGETINGMATLLIPSNESATFLSNGTNFNII